MQQFFLYSHSETWSTQDQFIQGGSSKTLKAQRPLKVGQLCEMLRNLTLGKTILCRKINVGWKLLSWQKYKQIRRKVNLHNKQSKLYFCIILVSYIENNVTFEKEKYKWIIEIIFTIQYIFEICSNNSVLCY